MCRTSRWTCSSGGSITFKSTSSTQQTINFHNVGNIVGTGGVIIDGVGSSYQLAGPVKTAGWTYANGSSFDSNSQTITLTTNQAFAGGGNTYFSVVMSGVAGTFPITGANTFGSLSWTGATGGLTLAANQTVTGTLTLAGNSTINRGYVCSNTRGTQRAITNTGATMTWSNVDFEDIGLTTSFNASAITGKSGDCGGNSNITFTTGINCYLVIGANANWSASNWFTTSGGAVAARVPLPQDTAKIDANSITAGSVTITQDMPRVGAIDFTGVTNTPTFSQSVTVTFYGSLTLSSGVSSYTGSQVVTYSTRSSISITSAGKTITDSTLVISAPGGTVTIADAFTGSSSTQLNHSIGSLAFANVDVSALNFASASSNTRTLTLGSGTFTLTGAASAWTVTSTLTVSATTGTIKFTNTASASGLTFAGGGVAYNNVWFARGARTESITISGSNTFADFRDTGTAAHSILFTAGTTQTVTTFSVSGSAGNLITINSTTTGTHALVKTGGGTISCDYLSVQHSVATPASTWYAGANSTDNQAAATAGSGWTFTVAPQNLTRTMSDAPSSSDALARTLGAGRALSDAPSTSDALARAATLSRAMADAPSTSDSLAKSAAFVRAMTDAPATADAWARTIVAGRTLPDAPSSDDSFTRTLGAVRDLSDAPQSTDAFARLFVGARSLADAPSSSDVLARTLGAARALSDAPLATDALARTLGVVRALTDAPLTTDALAPVIVIARTMTDSATTTDIFAAQKSIARTIADAPSTADSFARLFVGVRTMADAPSTSDFIVAISPTPNEPIRLIYTVPAPLALMYAVPAAISLTYDMDG